MNYLTKEEIDGIIRNYMATTIKKGQAITEEKVDALVNRCNEWKIRGVFVDLIASRRVQVDWDEDAKDIVFIGPVKEQE